MPGSYEDKERAGNRCQVLLVFYLSPPTGPRCPQNVAACPPRKLDLEQDLVKVTVAPWSLFIGYVSIVGLIVSLLRMGVGEGSDASRFGTQKASLAQLIGNQLAGLYLWDKVLLCAADTPL